MCDQGSLRGSSSSFWSLLLCVQVISCRQLLSPTQSISSILVADEDVLLYSWTVSLVLSQRQAFSPPFPLPASSASASCRLLLDFFILAKALLLKKNQCCHK